MESREIDYKHVVKKRINGCQLSLYFTKSENPQVKDAVLNILMDSFETRVIGTEGSH